MAQLPTGTVTFLFSDIEGSTQLLQRLGDDYARVQDEHQALLRAAFAAHSGGEVDTQGDSFFVAFPTAPTAVTAAAQATRALATHAWPSGAVVRVRIGLHTGGPLRAGDHYVGLDVHRAARIAAAGYGGQVLLSQTTRDLVEHTLPAGATLRDLGEHRLKDLQHAERLYQLVLSDLPSDFPPLKTLDARPHNLPVQPTMLLGREQALAAVCALLRRDDVRLVTLTGPGGIGKTRLAIQVAAEVLDDFPDGVWLVRLSRLSDPSLVLPTAAQTLGLKDAAGQPIVETLRTYLREKQLLLLLDNFEQVVGAAPEVSALLESAPHLKALVTSRVSLHLRGERESPLDPLLLPDPEHLPPPERLSQYAAVALFVERAQGARPDFAVTAANAPAIAEICARLDGLPLAIELAAARVKLLPPEALLARLSSGLKLLTGGARDLEERQRTMRATIAWSESLLGPEERLLFRRLAVFVGRCTLEAIEAICVAPEGAEPLGLDLLDGLGTLVDQSLVQQREGEGGEPRFGLLQVIREFALEQLEERAAEAEALRRAHAAYYLTLAQQAGQGLVVQPHQVERLIRLDREHDNLRAALGWSRDHSATDTFAALCAALGPFWVVRGYWNEGRRWAAQALSVGEALPAQQRARLLAQAGYFARLQGDYAAAMRQYGESLALFRGVEDRVGAGHVLAELGLCALAQEQVEQTRRLFEESLLLLQEVGDRAGMLDALKGQAHLADACGDYPTSRRLHEQALALAQSLGDTHDIAECKMHLGWHTLLGGHGPAAQALLHEALVTQRQASDTNCSGISLGYLAMVALERGDAIAAQALVEESIALFEQIAAQPRIAGMLIWLGAARLARGDVEGAADAYLASLRIERGLANRRRTAACWEHLAEVALARVQPERAARFLGAAAQTLGALAPAPLPPRLAAVRERAALAARQALGEEAWAAAFAAGRALSLEEAIAEALDEVD